ncbi:unnamed protein product [Trichogramma brassicae]|uniref:Uncharacterized protein n=1 Tax=Trichogramma brassicae TaxID=86971 RepID=A0A6H5HZD9_9HYME|nr:unnamed protein product [Trichogramma brassicae]
MSHFYANNGRFDGKPYVEHWPTLGRSPPASPPASPPPPAFDWATIIRRMRIAELLRRWNLSFRGDETDQATWEFLERLGEFFRRHAGARDFAQQQEILIALPCVFTGPAALEWYTAWRPKLRTWRDFREAFEARFCDHYREIVYDCRQRLGEKMSEFVARLRDIVSRIRHQWWGDERELVQLVFKNVLPEYRYWMKRYRDRIDSLSTLEEYGSLFELLDKEEDTERLLKHMIERLESPPDLKNRGVDPNVVAPETGDSPLHLALANDQEFAAELLLQRDANPNLVDATGSTPLHVICARPGDQWHMAERLFELSDEKYRPLKIDAQDKLCKTPLLVAVVSKNVKVAKLLLKRGADPKLADTNGVAPRDIISLNEDLARMLSD